MLRALANEDLPWAGVHIYQVDERVAPEGDPDRNLTHLRESLLQHAPIPPGKRPCDAGGIARSGVRPPASIAWLSRKSLDRRRCWIWSTWVSVRTATPHRWCRETRCSMFTDADVAVTGVYQGRRRMTLTYPALNRARRVLWVVTGSEKVEMLRRLVDADQSIPAGRVRREQALVLADRDAAGALRSAQPLI